MTPGFIAVTDIKDKERAPCDIELPKARIAINMIYWYKGHLTNQYTHEYTVILYKEGGRCETFQACETPEEIDKLIAEANYG